MEKYNNNGISRYGNSWDGTLFCFCQEVPSKLSYNGIQNELICVEGCKESGVGVETGLLDFVIETGFGGCPLTSTPPSRE